jgi:hypothetical protein
MMLDPARRTRFYERVNGAPPPNSARARVICIRKAKNGITNVLMFQRAHTSLSPLF